MKKLSILSLVLVSVLAYSLAFAQTADQENLQQEQQEQEPAYQEPLMTDEIPPDQFYRAKILTVLEEQSADNAGKPILTQKLRVKFVTGDLKDQEKELMNDGVFTINGGKPLKKGDQILVYKTSATGEEQFYIADTYRVPSLLVIMLGFFVLAVVLSRWKGVTSILGLVISILVIARFIVPQIIAGRDPLMISLVGALVIALVSIYLAHGFNKKTTIALGSTLITLVIAAGLSILFVKTGKLFGLGSEEAFYIQQLGTLQDLNLQGLLLGGIILGALGVLDDITTAQTAAIYEIKRANSSLNTKELFSRGLIVGREHISSLVNTLFLAYAGASLPLFLFFTVGGSNQPLWVTLNSEFIAEEVVRTLVGSIALMLAVPITTFLAAYYFGKRKIDENEPALGSHAGHSH
jgi:uncharacterized membrane protein